MTLSNPLGDAPNPASAATAPSLAAPALAFAPIFARMLLCSFLWATSFLLMKQIGPAIQPLALTAVRGVLGAVLLAGWLLLTRRSIVPRGREWRDWIILGLTQGVIPNTATAYALYEITAGLSSMLQASSPLMVAILAHGLFHEERLGPQRIGGLLIGLAGMAILIGPAAFEGGASLSGTLAMLVTGASYAIGNLYVRVIPNPDPARLALGQQAFSGLPALAVVLATAGLAPFAAVGDHWGALVLLGVFATAVPIVVFMDILRRAGPTIGSMNGYLTPVWTVIMGSTLLGEAIKLREVAGGAAILVGLILVATSRRPARATPVAPATAEIR